MAIPNFDCRNVYFDNLGKQITGVQKTEVAIKLAGLDYLVESQPIYLADGTEIENKKANVRSDNNQILGVVGKDYCILQNIEGFEFLDELIEGGAEFEAAGSFDKGRGAFMVAKTKPVEIVGDTFIPYILFINTHDGSGSVKALLTPVRVACSNAFILAEKSAEVKISVKHSKNVKDRLKIAQDILRQNEKYMGKLKKEIEAYANVPMSAEQFTETVTQLSGLNDEECNTKVKQDRAQELIQDCLTAYEAPDVQQFKNTVYGALLAISDVECHREPMRKTNNPEIYFNRILLGMSMLNQTLKIIKSANMV